MTLPVHLSSDSSDVLMPMHLRVSAQGLIVHVAPTLAKLRALDALLAKPFLSVFQIKRPRGIRAVSQLRLHPNQRLHLQFRDSPETSFKGVLVLNQDQDEILVNLSFGISILEATQDYSLLATDFAPTDLTVEMLYLIEAKTAILEEWRRLNTRLETARVTAEEQAFTDTLTGLKNRRAMDYILDRLVAARQPFGLIHLDLDYFKQVNDQYGHAAGDAVLQKAAQIMQAGTRDGDTIVRSGGDEFVLILPEARSDRTLSELSARLIGELEKPIEIDQATCQISCSAGATRFDGDPDTNIADLFRRADDALYQSKNAGRGRFTLYEANDASAAAGTGSINASRVG